MVNTKCPPVYKNLGLETFGNKKKVTDEILRQCCKNDEWLKRKSDELYYHSPARIRKRWKPILVDSENSYGYEDSTSDNTVTFSQSTSDKFTITFEDMSHIDTSKSDCSFKTFTVDGKVRKCATIPMETTSAKVTNCKSPTEGWWVNAFWYVGYDKSKPYHIRPDWIKDWKDSEIPSVCRGQTFTVPTQDQDGNSLLSADLRSNGEKLEIWGVDLRVESNGVTNSNWASPLYVQLWKTKEKYFEKTQWVNWKKKNESYNPKEYEPIYYPVGTPQTALATASYQPNITEPFIHTFVFDKKVEVKGGEHYAIVMLSPLSHWEHCPRIAGWTRHCDAGKDPNGDAFLSENNGRTWQRYGKTDLTISEYRQGQELPGDFRYSVRMDKYSDGYVTDEDFYLYLKPIHSNPIKGIQLVPNGYGNEDESEDVSMVFEVSKSGRANSWITLDATELSHDFTPDATTGEYPHFAFIRVKMKTENSDDAPYLESLKVILDTDIPKEMYVRTIPYNPKTTPMLGATAWSKFGSQFETEENVRGSCEIISEKISVEHFFIITASELDLFADLPGLDRSKILYTDINGNEVGTTDEVRYKYLMEDENALKILKSYNVYVKPHTYIENNVTKKDDLSFREELGGSIQFNGSPAYPILKSNIISFDNGTLEIPIAEWIDYVFDYDNDTLTFNEVLNQYSYNGAIIEEGMEEFLPVGIFEVYYHPIFVQDLTSEDVGIRDDSEGFVLDYFKEEFVLDNIDAQNRYIQLKFTPCDPIRELVINDKEYIEDIHFTVDYDNKRILFPPTGINNTSLILNENLGEEMYVVYTPSLEDAGLIIGYRGIRDNTVDQMIIRENYIEYKV